MQGEAGSVLRLTLEREGLDEHIVEHTDQVSKSERVTLFAIRN